VTDGGKNEEKTVENLGQRGYNKPEQKAAFFRGIAEGRMCDYFRE
jgi:hypothetical protein